LLASGCWPFIKQRPYDVIAKTANTPKAIFISAYASAPLAADYDYALAGKENELQAAITALSKLTTGEVHVSIGKNANSPLAGLNNISLHKVSGPHPSGNVGTQIAKISPINKGENCLDNYASRFGDYWRIVFNGKFNAERTIALTGFFR